MAPARAVPARRLRRVLRGHVARGEQYADVGFDLGGEAHAGWAVEARFDANVRLVTGVDPNEEEEDDDDDDDDDENDAERRRQEPPPP